MPYRDKNYGHVFMIGTNRFLGESVESYINEIQFMESRLGQKVPFVIIEEGNLSIGQKNKELIEEIKHQYPDNEVVYFTLNEQKKYFDYFRKLNFEKNIIDLLDFEGVSYGRILNKQFLLAVTFGADHIHRRDSDTKLLPGAGLPSEVELKYLGRKVGEIKDLLPASDIKYDDEQEIYLAGSGYSGGADWKMDYGLFFPQDKDVFYKMNGFFGLSEELTSQYYHEITSGNNMVKEEAKFLPKEDHSNPDCGNISYFKVHRYLPCSPVQRTIGSDYFITFLLNIFELPAVYHNRFVFHGFTSERKEESYAYIMEYWSRVFNFLDYYDVLQENILELWRVNGRKVIKLEETAFGGFLENYTTDEGNKKKRKDKIAALCEILSEAKSSRIREIALNFNNKLVQDEIISNTDKGIEDHRKLLSAWRDITKAAENYNIL